MVSPDCTDCPPDCPHSRTGLAVLSARAPGVRARLSCCALAETQFSSTVQSNAHGTNPFVSRAPTTPPHAGTEHIPCRTGLGVSPDLVSPDLAGDGGGMTADQRGKCKAGLSWNDSGWGQLRKSSICVS